MDTSNGQRLIILFLHKGKKQRTIEKKNSNFFLYSIFYIRQPLPKDVSAWMFLWVLSYTRVSLKMQPPGPREDKFSVYNANTRGLKELNGLKKVAGKRSIHRSSFYSILLRGNGRAQDSCITVFANARIPAHAGKRLLSFVSLSPQMMKRSANWNIDAYVSGIIVRS